LVPLRSGSISAQRIDLPDGVVVVGVTSAAADVARTVARVSRAIASGALVAGVSTVGAIEIVVPAEDGIEPDAVAAAVSDALSAARLPAARCTLSWVQREGDDVHRTWVRAAPGVREETSLLGIHPEIAARVGFARLQRFALERLPGADDLYCFWGRSRDVPDDERLFVLGDVRDSTLAQPD